MSALPVPFDLGALSPLARELASAVARVSSDIALVIDEQGVIQSVAEGVVPLAPGCSAWVGRHWADVASTDTRPKIELLLGELRSAGIARRREVNHPLPDGNEGKDSGKELPLAWSAIRLGQRGPYLAVGRDLRVVAAIQQRFLDAQQELERDYWQRQQAEQRYRVLFHVERDAIFVVESGRHEVIEANEAAARWLGRALPAAAIGMSLPQILPASIRGAVSELLMQASGSGHAGEIRVRVAAAAAAADDVSATPFRAGDRQLMLVRVRRVEAAPPTPAPAQATSPAVLVADPSGRILMANSRLVELAGAPDDAALRGRGLAEVLGETEPGWAHVLATVRRQGLITQAVLKVHRAGSHEPRSLEVTATMLTDGEQECVGVTLRPGAVPSPAASAPRPVAGLTGTADAADTSGSEQAAREIMRSLEELDDQVGHAPLSELLAEAALAGERHLLGSVLRRCGGDEVLAARLLDLPTPSLVMQLRRLGLDTGRGFARTPPLIN